MPYLTFEAVTSMTKKEALEKLESSLTKMNWLGQAKESKPFFGTVSASSFKIMRVVTGRDSFNPMVYGNLWSANRQTHVRVVITFHPAVWVFLVFWALLVGNGFVTALLNHGGIDTLLLFGMFMFPWLLGIPLFYYNASKSRKLLKERLKLAELPKIGG